ncbi:MAG TPA: MarR family transcriptional regulator [Caproicibacter sp.]|nr:MarR family transcriptional regulator [Caproicibacter sp.]
MNQMESPNQLRELIRELERKLGILQETQNACCSVTLAQCHALVEIGRAGRISLNELSDKLDIENSSMSRTVNKLVTSNLASRNIDPNDRRYVTISLTESGLEQFHKVEKDMNAYFQKIYTAIPENKQNQVMESIQILLDAISKCQL